jgi:hypothetical protein
VADSAAMGESMAREVEQNHAQNKVTRAIIPCGRKCRYAPFARLVNSRSQYFF